MKKNEEEEEVQFEKKKSKESFGLLHIHSFISLSLSSFMNPKSPLNGFSNSNSSVMVFARPLIDNCASIFFSKDW